jgi:hypothetical protein
VSEVGSRGEKKFEWDEIFICGEFVGGFVFIGGGRMLFGWGGGF